MSIHDQYYPGNSASWESTPDIDAPPLKTTIAKGEQPPWWPWRTDEVRAYAGEAFVSLAKVTINQWRSWRWIKWLQRQTKDYA